MPQPWVHGPCEVHVGVGASGALAFLGWSEAGVRISEAPSWDDVPSDLAGSVAHDVQFMGAQSYVSLDTTVWDESVLARIQARPKPSGTRGTYDTTSVGTLMITEQNVGASLVGAFRLLCYSPYAALGAFLGTAGVLGVVAMPHYNFPTAWLAGPDDIDPLGSRHKKIRLVFRALGVYSTSTGWTFYNTTTTGRTAPTSAYA